MVNFLKDNWGNLATVLGFLVTIWTLWRTRTAAEAAQRAAEHTKTQLSRVNTVAEFSSALATMEEIKRLHRARAWEIVPDRYTSLRRLLISIQTLNPDLTGEQRTALTASISQLKTIEHKVETARAANRHAELDFARFNRIVTSELDSLERVMLAIKQAGI